MYVEPKQLNEMAERCGLEPPAEHRYKTISKNIEAFRRAYTKEMLRAEYPIRRTGRSTLVILEFLCIQEEKGYDSLLIIGRDNNNARMLRQYLLDLGQKAGVYVPRTIALAPKGSDIIGKAMKKCDYVIVEHPE